ncbi:hypothetical protein H0H87_002888 [Tephrocybe sp. NHM501043]|nr:hypothetical protein H0H87_002888 [Tephrocybe sp. NHM501043]
MQCLVVCLEFLEAQGIAAEPELESSQAPLKRQPMRRVVSLPPSMPSMDMPTPPRKKAKVAMISQLVSPRITCFVLDRRVCRDLTHGWRTTHAEP